MKPRKRGVKDTEEERARAPKTQEKVLGRALQCLPFFSGWAGSSGQPAADVPGLLHNEKIKMLTTEFLFLFGFGPGVRWANPRNGPCRAPKSAPRPGVTTWGSSPQLSAPSCVVTVRAGLPLRAGFS